MSTARIEQIVDQLFVFRNHGLFIHFNSVHFLELTSGLGNDFKIPILSSTLGPGFRAVIDIKNRDSLFQ
jgi:hypothetical protein